MRAPHHRDLLVLWNQHWSPCPPTAHLLRAFHPERWVRFHSLPDSKRYPADDGEMAILLDRHYVVLAELFDGAEILIITSTWSDTPTPPELSEQEAADRGPLWTSFLSNDDTNPDFRVYTHRYARRTAWGRGTLDTLLRATAMWETADVMISDLTLSRIYHPYDGGADVLLRNSPERNDLRARHTPWLPPNPTAL